VFAAILSRIIQSLGVMLVMSAIVFIGVYAVGNPIDVLISPEADQKIRAEVIALYGLDQPLWHQYSTFLGRLVQGDFGTSFVFGVPVMDVIMTRVPATLELVVISLGTATLLGVPLGMYAGYNPDSAVARAIMGFSILGFSVPTFWIGVLLIYTFSVHLGVLPAGGRGETAYFLGAEWSFLTADGWRHLLLPALNISFFTLSIMIRLARAGTRELMLTDTIKMARAMGLSEMTILRHHVLKLISIPIVTVFGLELATTVAFAVVTETIFSWPGIGKLIIDSIALLDRPLIVAYLILVSFLFIMVNLTVDILYTLLDPRLRRSETGA